MVSAKTVVLIVSIVMPADVPDVSHVEQMKSLDACWVAAREYVEHGLAESTRERGAIGLKAGCAYQESNSEEN